MCDDLEASSEPLIDDYTIGVLERLAIFHDCEDLCHLLPQCDAASFIERILDRHEENLGLVQKADKAAQSAETDELDDPLDDPLEDFDAPDEPELPEFVFAPEKVLPPPPKPFDRAFNVLNAFFATVELPYAELEAMAISMTPIQQEVVFALLEAYPELSVRDKEVTAWGLLNTVVDILCGRRLGLLVNKESQLIHGVQWITGLRQLPEETQSEPSQEQLGDRAEEGQRTSLHGSH